MGRTKKEITIVEDINILAERSDEIDIETDGKKVAKIIKELKDKLYSIPELVTLAAPQIGHPYRIFCIKFADGDIRTFINPMITKVDGLHLAREIDISLPGREFIIPRHDKIIAMYQTPTNQVEQNIFEGAVGEVFQHSVQVLDGILINDMGLEIFEDFDLASDEERNEVLNMYLDTIKLGDEALQKEIESDEELRESMKAIDFLQGVADGSVTLLPNEKDNTTKESNGDI